MTMTIRKSTIALGLLGIIGCLAAGSVFAPGGGVSAANTASVSAAATTSPAQRDALIASGDGAVTLRGTVDAVSAKSLTIRSWGGDWQVAVPTSAQMLPQGTVLHNFKQGDFVSVQGAIDPDNNWSIIASSVRDQAGR